MQNEQWMMKQGLYAPEVSSNTRRYTLAAYRVGAQDAITKMIFHRAQKDGLVSLCWCFDTARLQHTSILGVSFEMQRSVHRARI